MRNHFQNERLQAIGAVLNNQLLNNPHLIITAPHLLAANNNIDTGMINAWNQLVQAGNPALAANGLLIFDRRPLVGQPAAGESLALTIATTQGNAQSGHPRRRCLRCRIMYHCSMWPGEQINDPEMMVRNNYSSCSEVTLWPKLLRYNL